MMLRPLESDSGVSENVGYILILGIIVTAIGLTYLMGYPMLQNMINSGHIQNMERGFIILGNNIDRVMEQSTPMQNTELSLEGGTVRNIQDGTFNITITHTDGTVTMDSWDMYAIIYDYPGSSREIGYEFGGAMEKYGAGSEVNGGTVLKEPKIVVGDPFIIPIVNIYGSIVSKGGSGLAEVIMYGADTNIIKHEDVHHVDLRVQGDFYLAWKDYFKGAGMAITYEDAPTRTIQATYTPANPITVVEVNKPITMEIE